MPVVKDHLPAVHDAAHSQIDAAFRCAAPEYESELVQKRAADQPGADHAD